MIKKKQTNKCKKWAHSLQVFFLAISPLNRWSRKNKMKVKYISQLINPNFDCCQLHSPSIWLFPINISHAQYNVAPTLMYPEKPISLPQVTDKLYHILLYQVHLAWAGFESQEVFEDDKGVIGICKSTKDRQHHGQQKEYYRTNTDLQSIHINLKIM